MRILCVSVSLSLGVCVSRGGGGCVCVFGSQRVRLMLSGPVLVLMS